MNFDLLPDNVFLEIFRYLPLETQARLGRLSKSFRRASVFAVSELTSLDLDEIRFGRIDSTSFAALLQFCSNRLESIKFPGFVSTRRDLATSIAQFPLNRLITLDLGYSRISSVPFAALLRNAPRLQTLTWNLMGNSEYRFDFDNITCEHLRTLDLDMSRPEFLNALVGRCPNLRHFEIDFAISMNEQGFENFFEHCPSIESILFKHMDRYPLRNGFAQFWRLQSLRTLALRADYDETPWLDDSILIKIGDSFPRLESLHLGFINVTSQGVAELASLSRLRKLSLEHNNPAHDLNRGVQRLADCGRLEVAQIDEFLTQFTVLKLVRKCPRLRYLWVYGIRRVDWPQDAFALAQLLCVPIPRPKEIQIKVGCAEMANLWELELVKKALDEAKSKEGNAVTIEKGGLIWKL